MRYYTIIDNEILTAENQQALTRFYANVKELPNDYEKNKYIVENGELVLNPDYEAEQTQKRQEQFETEFFNTSLGYIRRKVTMANGDTKDFLTDLLPSIAMGIQLNQPVAIITYIEPDFTKEFTDLVKYQEIQQATAEFVQECFMQLNNDFMPAKEANSTSEASEETSNEDETSSNPSVDNNEEIEE